MGSLVIMIVAKFAAILSLAAVSLLQPVKKTDDVIANPVDHVDLFYGTDGGGHVFPGPSRPFGMAKLGLDSIEHKFGDAYSGYTPGGVVTGISMMHESGTGGVPQYGVVSQLPFIGDFNPKVQTNLTRTGDDVAHVGYYSFKTKDGIDAEFAVAERSGILHYTFPSGTSPQILVNVSHHLATHSRPWWTQEFVNGTITANDDLTGYSGFATIKGGWGLQAPWTIYFSATFESPAALVIGFEGTSVNSNKIVSSDYSSMGLVFSWSALESSISTKVGISHISTKQAHQNLVNDLDAHNYDLQSVVLETQKIWTDEVLNKIQVTDLNSTLSSYIYTSLYGSHLIPTNKTGEYPLNKDAIYYDDWFTIWDTFRCLNPLLNVINPTRSSELVQSLINIYKKEGYTPDGRSANQNGRTQGGSNSDIVMADAYLKGVKNVNWTDAFAAMVKNAEVTPPYFKDNMATDASNQQGRGALPDWLKYGYVTRNFTRSVSRTMDYAYDDYALSVVAKGLNNNTAHEMYLRRSANWQLIWNSEATAKGYNYRGFIQPRASDGSWETSNYDPFSCGGCYWGNDEYEGKPVEYGWSVPYDIETLKTLIGNDEMFMRRLDDMYGLRGKEVVDVGNEPSFLTPYLYNYVGHNYKTVETVRYIIDTHFTVGRSGLPGNSDGGAMQSWLLFGLMGFYPVAGTTTYLFSSPYLPYINLNFEGGNTLKITASGLSQKDIYIKTVIINGNNYDKNWIDHDTLMKGGYITFEMTLSPVQWEKGDLPPSPGHYQINS